MIDALLSQLETDLRASLGTFVTELVTTARARLENAVALVAEERTRGLTEVAKERAEVAVKRAELSQEIEVMRVHREMQQGRVELNIGGYHFETSVQTLQRVPHTFFDAYFSGRYAQDVCNDGSIFIDRDGEHFGHILEYMRDGHVSVAESDARPSVSLLRTLKREFGFYCIELHVGATMEPEQPGVAYVMGGYQDGGTGTGALSTMERYSTSGWSAAAAMGTPRYAFGRRENLRKWWA
jgi:hypothetical protein